jgi:hypothetical protein
MLHFTLATAMVLAACRLIEELLEQADRDQGLYGSGGQGGRGRGG